MDSSADLKPWIALARFGLGRRGAEPLPADPAAWLAAQLGPAAPPEPVPVGGADSAGAFAALEERRRNPPPEGQPGPPRLVFDAEVATLADRALATDQPFRERLVRFWANHFTVSTRDGQVAPFAGDYVRTAIRPYVTARFGDMLLAVMRHPAMLLYLNQAGSVGPGSPAGLRSGRGLNENLARECLELHTVSPDAGYTQADVTSFARLLTGWSVQREAPGAGFRFRPFAHEPGEQVVLGRTFPNGEAGAAAALGFLAAHPATHRHLATKLVRHFVADDPLPGDVRAVEAALRDTGGDLGAAALAVTRLPSAWTPSAKLRAPQDFAIAALRAADLAPADAPEKRPPLPGIAAGLGQPWFGAPAPNGWGDSAADWSGPEAVLRRVDWAYGFGGRPELPEPDALAAASLGPLARPATLTAMRRAGSRRDAVALLLTSPEFQRR
jgi:uncharacterized protein (DUF1800 family)